MRRIPLSSRQAFRPPHAIPASGKPPVPRRHQPALGRAIGGDRKPHGIAVGLPLGNDGNAVAELDQAVRSRRAVVLDRDAALPKGRAVREQEARFTAPFFYCSGVRTTIFLRQPGLADAALGRHAHDDRADLLSCQPPVHEGNPRRHAQRLYRWISFPRRRRPPLIWTGRRPAGGSRHLRHHRCILAMVFPRLPGKESALQALRMMLHSKG